MLLQSGDRFVLIGDSITDAGRRREPSGILRDTYRAAKAQLSGQYCSLGADPLGLGCGYVAMFFDMMTGRYPDLDVEIVNQGISGDTVRHLAARWEQDVIELKPTVLSVSIGVNDVWRFFQDPRSPEEVPLDEFEAAYRRLLEETRARIGCRLVLCEATVIGETTDTPHNRLLTGYNRCIAQLAQEFDAVLVPMNQAFWSAIEAHPFKHWTTDGVHPLERGHQLMALTLFETLDACVP